MGGTLLWYLRYLPSKQNKRYWPLHASVRAHAPCAPYSLLAPSMSRKPDRDARLKCTSTGVCRRCSPATMSSFDDAAAAHGFDGSPRGKCRAGWGVGEGNNFENRDNDYFSFFFRTLIPGIRATPPELEKPSFARGKNYSNCDGQLICNLR